ncbi:MAG: DEAD/DEAH box helicase [Myxococcales bacterium]|nr:DEAD/DEAH box helicase [Myxococcales bacterium]
MRALFEAVRAACDPGTWSRGVELVRQAKLTTEQAEDDEVVIRVASRRSLLTPTVVLYPEAIEWDCDCDSPREPCDHVAAAAIVMERAQHTGEEVPGESEAGGRLGYRFTRTEKGLEFYRVVVTGDDEIPLEASLKAIVAGAAVGPDFLASDADLRVEDLLGRKIQGVLPATLMRRLLGALRQCDDVRIDGESVTTSVEPVLPIARLEDRGDGFVLQVRAAPDTREVFANGVALSGTTLCPRGDDALTHRDRSELVPGKYFPPQAAKRIVSEVLPRLERRIPIEIHTARLPRSEASPPRLQVDVTREGDELCVAASLVYGDPPTARIENERLVHLGGAVPIRNPAAEQRLIARLRLGLDLVPGQQLRLRGGEAVEVALKLRAWSGELRGEAHHGFFFAPELEPVLSIQDASFDLSFLSPGAQGRAATSLDPRHVLEAWDSGDLYVPLSSGGLAPLPLDWLDRFGRQVADLLEARAAAGADRELPACMIPDLARLCAALGETPPPKLERLRALLEDFDELPAPELPEDLEAELRPYQERGVRWLQFLRDAGLGGLLADDMGLGKTLEALCAIQGRTLVVCPTSVLYGWREQIARFRPGLRVCVYHGQRRKLDPEADVTLTSYALLRIDAEKLGAIDWETAVLDEAQAIKNPGSKAARAAFELRAKTRFTLTGTPIENRLEELWSQFHFTNPGLLGSLADFRKRYAQPIATGQPGAAAHLRARIRPFVLRRLKQEVAPELPPRTEAVLHAELSEAERNVYRAVHASVRRDVAERLRAGGGVIEALEALLRLRQAACHSSLVPGQQADSSAKLEVLLEALDEVLSEGHRALVFSQWTSFLDLLEPHLDAAGISFARLDGSTRDRGAVVEEFQDPSGPPLLLISLRAGGTGLNLTAADHVFLLDPWWNPAVEDQAADRAHRIGQERPVMIYRIVARETVEERVLALQQRKRALAEAALAGSDRAASITREELLQLLD